MVKEGIQEQEYAQQKACRTIFLSNEYVKLYGLQLKEALKHNNVTFVCTSAINHFNISKVRMQLTKETLFLRHKLLPSSGGWKASVLKVTFCVRLHLAPYLVIFLDERLGDFI